MAATPRLHLIKLCVGAARIDDLREWQASRAAAALAGGADSRPLHVTRMWPRRADELLDGGSLYWVFKGYVLARQRIAALEAVDWGDGVARCGIRLDAAITPTEARPCRPFQGWRYLASADAPADLLAEGEAALPPELQAALADIGVSPRRTRAG